MGKKSSLEVGENDVLYGRGGSTNKNSGNVNFRTLILAYQPQYKQSRRIFKPRIAEMIVQIIRTRGGRFLKYDDSKDELVEVDDEMAVTKTSQALRDTVPMDLPSIYTVDRTKPTGRGRRKKPKNPSGIELGEDQTHMLPSNQYSTPYSEATKMLYRNGGEATGFMNPNGSENSSTTSANVYTQSYETYPDVGGMIKYTQEYDARAHLAPPQGFQPRLHPASSYPTDRSSGLSAMNHQPNFDARTHNMNLVGFQQQNLHQQLQQQQQRFMSNMNMIQRQMSLQNQSSMAIPPPGYYQQISKNQYQQHSSSYRHPLHSTIPTAGLSYPNSRYLDSLRNSTQIPIRRIQESSSMYPSSKKPYSMDESSFYPSGQYLGPGGNTSSIDFRSNGMIESPQYPFATTTRSSLTRSSKDDYQDSLVNRYYAPNPNYRNLSNSMPTQPIGHFSQSPQPILKAHGGKGFHTQYDTEMTRLAFLPPQDSSSSSPNSNLKVEDNHHENGKKSSVPNVDSKASLDEKNVPV